MTTADKPKHTPGETGTPDDQIPKAVVDEMKRQVGDSDEFIERKLREAGEGHTPGEWRDIATAPKGGGASRCDDPNWVEPPKLLLVVDGQVTIGYWDYYYAEGGRGYERGNGIGWVDACNESMPCAKNPTDWMPLPDPPKAEGQS